MDPELNKDMAEELDRLENMTLEEVIEEREEKEKAIQKNRG